MSATALLVRKEMRALGGLWLAIVAGILAGELPRHDLRGNEVVFYAFGALALGAASMGHEYRYGTMAQLLIAIETGEEPAISGRDNLRTMALVDAAYQSASEHCAISLAPCVSR